MALSAYRQVLRSARITFHGDPRILSAARVEARLQFDQDRSLPADSSAAEQKISEAREVARILRQNIVQGQQVAGSGQDEQTYQLRIHDDIERGDNETIKKGNSLKNTESCCGRAS